MHHDRGIAGMAVEAGSRELTSRATNKAERVTSKWHSTTSCGPSVQIHEPMGDSLPQALRSSCRLREAR